MKVVALGQALIRQPLTWPADLRARLAGADAVICNFEGCRPPAGTWPMKLKTVHPAPDSALPALRDLGVTHLTIANNHVWDYGHAGLVETRRQALAAGFAVAGAGVDLAEAGAMALANGVAVLAADTGPTPDWAIAGHGPGVNPLRLHLTLGLPDADIARLRAIDAACGALALRDRRAAIGYDQPRTGPAFRGLPLAAAPAPTEIWTADPADMARLATAIHEARKQARLVIVALHYHHWGPDWTRPPQWLGRVAQDLVTAGADAVLCSGPPVVHEPEITGGSLIAPGMGNLVFHTARGARYDALGLPVWSGGLAIWENGAWKWDRIDVLRPES